MDQALSNEKSAKDVAVDRGPTVAARVGYVAKGAVYLTVGVLAVMTAVGAGGGEAGGSKNAIAELLATPYGYVIVVALAIGLACYAGWRWYETVTDPEHPGETDTKKRVARRVFYLASAVIYTALTIWTVKLLIGRHVDSSGSAGQWTADLMSLTWGRILVGLLGVMVVAGGIVEITRAVKQSFMKKLKLHRLGQQGRKTVKMLGSVGLTARAIVFWVIGGSLLYAAWNANPNEAKSLGTALASLRDQPYGAWIFGGVSLGLAAYGAYQIVTGLLRRVPA